MPIPPQILQPSELFPQYMRLKHQEWVSAARLETGDYSSPDPAMAARYIHSRDYEGLADEFRRDNRFASHRICEFMNNTTDESVTGVVVSAGGMMFGGDLVAAPGIVLAALRMVCGSPKTENLAAPIVIAAVAVGVVVVLVSVFGGGQGERT